MTKVISYPGERTESYEYGKEGFLQEAQTLAEFIGNENIVRIHSYFEENGTAYFVMDFIEGVSLDEYIKEKGGKISVDEAQNIVVPIMDALGAVHSKGIVHRDVTPDNIYITKDNTVKLLDFGAARYSLGDKSRSLDVILKHGFAPKEQYTRRGKQGPFTDIYSLAATFYFAITGKRPPDSIERMDDDDLIQPSTLGVKITERQEDAILKALNVQPAERFQTMADFKTALLNESSSVQQTFFNASKKETPPVQTVQQVQTAVQPTQETQQPQPVLTPQKPTISVSGAAAALKGTNKKVLIGAAAIITALVITLVIVISKASTPNDKYIDVSKSYSSSSESSDNSTYNDSISGSENSGDYKDSNEVSKSYNSSSESSDNSKYNDTSSAVENSENSNKAADNSSIVPGIHTGMSQDEVFDVIGHDFISSFVPGSGAYGENCCGYNYTVDSIPALGCDMPAVMFFEFTKDKLYNFGYHIGYDLDKYYYGETELVEEYDRIYDLLKTDYNVSWEDCFTDSYKDNGIIKANSGSLKGSNEELWFVVVTDIWKVTGSNKITISCTDESLGPWN